MLFAHHGQRGQAVVGNLHLEGAPHLAQAGGELDLIVLQKDLDPFLHAASFFRRNCTSALALFFRST